MGAVPHAGPARPGLSPKGGAAQGTGTCPSHPDPASVPQVEFFLGSLCPGPTRGWFQLLPFPSTTEDHR